VVGRRGGKEGRGIGGAADASQPGFGQNTKEKKIKVGELGTKEFRDRIPDQSTEPGEKSGPSFVR